MEERNELGLAFWQQASRLYAEITLFTNLCPDYTLAVAEIRLSAARGIPPGVHPQDALQRSLRTHGNLTYRTSR